MENKDSEKKIVPEIVVEKDENTNSTVISKGSNGLHNINEQEHNDMKKASSPIENNISDINNNIKQENVAVNGIESPAEPSTMETKTIKNETMEVRKRKYSAKLAEMGEVREENERLKLLLARILKDYQSLRSNFFGILGQEEATQDLMINPKDHVDRHEESLDDRHKLLVSLSLGRTSSDDRDEKKTTSTDQISNGGANNNNNKGGDQGFDKLELALGSSSAMSNEIIVMAKSGDLSSDNNSSDHNHCDERKEDDDDVAEPTEIRPPSKVLKTTRPRVDDHEDGVSQISPLKKARVSVRTRCDTPTMNDGCQWRKYGQKISKGNPCPRAYYRCTVSPTCPVRKQVQRCAEDMSILITTYEGTHNHPLPISATAMASTTAAAASMLQSRSTTSSQPATSAPIINSFGPNNPLLLQTSINNNNNNLRQSPSLSLPNHQFYLPNTSISTLNSHPTVTLDLTLPNPNSPYYSHLGKSPLHRYPSTCLSFSSSSPSPSSSSLDIQNIINNGGYSANNGYFNYGTQPRHNYQIGSKLVANSSASGLYQPYSNVMSNIANTYNINGATSNNNDPQSLMMMETIAAATQAITSNPKFQSALAAALTSVIGDGGGSGSGSGSGSGV